LGRDNGFFTGRYRKKERERERERRKRVGGKLREEKNRIHERTKKMVFIFHPFFVLLSFLSSFSLSLSLSLSL